MKKSNVKSMSCKLCGSTVYNVNKDTIAVTCSQCVQEIVGPPVIKTNKKSGMPRGWKLYNEFVDKDGNVYHKGKLQLKLKGTLPVTEIKKSNINKKKKLSVREKDLIELQLLDEISIARTNIRAAEDKLTAKVESKKISKVQSKLKKIRGY